VTGEIVGFSPTSGIDGGGATYRWGQSSPIRLVFWVELGPRPVVVASVDLRPDETPARG
jgi:hypothetical protein